MIRVSLRKSFGQIKETSQPLILSARVRETGQVVKLSRHVLEKDEVHYDEEIHKGHLICSDCNAQVHVRKKTPVVAGGNLSPIDEHFVTNPFAGNAHSQDCSVRENRRTRFNTSRDKTLPIIIYHNLDLMPDRKDGIYSLIKRKDNNTPYIPTGGVRLPEDQLKGREVFSVTRALDLINIYNTVAADRTQKAVHLHYAHETKNMLFVVSYTEQGESFRGLISQLSRKPRPQRLVMMQVIAADGLEEDSDRVVSTPIYLKKLLGQKANLDIRPAIYIDTRDPEVRAMCREPGELWAYGYVSLRPSPTRNKGETIYHIAMSIKEKWQLERINMNDPHLEGREWAIPIPSPR